MRRVDDCFVWKLSQTAIKAVTPDVCVINGYVGEFGEFTKDQLINLTISLFAFA